MKVFEAQIEIKAPVEVVWEKLTNFSHYPQWNPFILRASGELKQGNTVRFRVAGQPMELSAPITSLIKNQEFIWEAELPIPGIQPRYIRVLQKIDDNRTLFINREEFSGWMVTLLSPILQIQLAKYYPMTCQALKTFVEDDL